MQEARFMSGVFTRTYATSGGTTPDTICTLIPHDQGLYLIASMFDGRN